MFICCINQITQKTVIERFYQHDDIVKKTFKTILDMPGNQSFKVMIFDGYGELEETYSKPINVARGTA